MVCDVANELVSPPPRPGLRNVGLGNRREGYLLGQDRGRLPSPYQIARLFTRRVIPAVCTPPDPANRWQRRRAGAAPHRLCCAGRAGRRRG